MSRPEPRPGPASRPGRLDRLARWVLPPLSTLGGRGTLLAPLALILALSLAAAGAAEPWLADAAARAAPGGDGEGAAWLWTVAALMPVLALVKGAFLASVAWALLVLAGGAPSFRGLLSALLYGEVLFALQGLWIAVALSAGGGGGARGEAVPVGALGLVAWVHPEGPVGRALAQGLTPFHVAWMVMLGLAFSALTRLPRARGLSVAGALWGLTVTLSVLRAWVP